MCGTRRPPPLPLPRAGASWTQVAPAPATWAVFADSQPVAQTYGSLHAVVMHPPPPSPPPPPLPPAAPFTLFALPTVGNKLWVNNASAASGQWFNRTITTATATTAWITLLVSSSGLRIQASEVTSSLGYVHASNDGGKTVRSSAFSPPMGGVRVCAVSLPSACHCCGVCVKARYMLACIFFDCVCVCA